MNNYLMFGHILKVRVMPAEQIHADLWKGANKRFKVVPRGMLERKSLEAAKGREYWKGKTQKEEKKRRSKRKAMEELGYEFEAPALRKVDDVPKKEAEHVEVEKSVDTGNGGEDLVKAIADAAAVVDDVQVELDQVIKESKKAKKEKAKVKVSKEAKV